MKKIAICLTLITLAFFTNAQKIADSKWHEFYLGGKKGYYNKTHIIKQNQITETQTGSGGSFDNKPTTTSIEKMIVNDTDERIISKYDDTTFMLIVFKNITATNASVCQHTETFKSMGEAVAFIPQEEDYVKWYTEAGFKKENAKPALPALTKKDMVEFAQLQVTHLKKISEKLASKKLDEGEKNFALAMSTIVIPVQFAEQKGYHPYKSLAVIEKAVTTFKNDATIKKIFIDAGFSDILTNK